MADILTKSSSVFKTILDVILPPVCYVCGKACTGTYGLCDNCAALIHHILPPYCKHCGKRVIKNTETCGTCGFEVSYLDRSWSCCRYETTIKHCIHLFKYSGYIGLVDIFSDLMMNFLRKNNIGPSIELIVPVPVYATKRRERGYNPSEVLARALSKKLSKPLDYKNLKKVKWTESQSELDKKRRLNNIKGAFLTVDRNVFSGRNILIVDDVFTTGATLNECAKVLKEINVKKVFSLTLARGV